MVAALTTRRSCERIPLGPKCVSTFARQRLCYARAMKIWLLGICLVALMSAMAQEDAFTLDAETIQAASQWAQENIDAETLRTLTGGDQVKVKEFLEEAQRKLQGEYIIDVAQLRDAAKLILPLLESSEETQPYAIWLRSRMDYLEVAEELRLRIEPPVIQTNLPSATTNSMVRRQLPTPEAQREIWISKVVKRSIPPHAQAYVKRLKPIFARQQLPPELVWIAEVESSFDPRAKSPAGAAGLFQLMPATAKQYGLKTWPLDQRYKPDESGDAAARHLAYLYRRFRDWRLAIAAYNAGEGTIQRALDRSRSKSFDAISSRLPAETQLYVPKVEATLRRREGVQLLALKGPAPKHKP
jgi:membrane-bound lytic murein transglycosylase D